MTQNLSDKEKEQVQGVKNHFVTKAMEIVNNEILPKVFVHNLPIRDIYYIIARIKQILEEKFNPINYSDPTIAKLRDALLRSNIKEAKSRKVSKPEKGFKTERCEPICREIVDYLLDENVLLSNPDFLGMAFPNDDKLLLQILTNGYVDNIADKLELAMLETKRKADDNIWDKYPEDITWKDLEEQLLDWNQKEKAKREKSA